MGLGWNPVPQKYIGTPSAPPFLLPMLSILLEVLMEVVKSYHRIGVPMSLLSYRM